MLVGWINVALAGIMAMGAAGLRPNPPLIDDPQLDSAGLSRYWEAHLPLVPGDSVLEGHLVDETLYVITDQGIVFALTAGEGLIRWADRLAEPDYVIYRPTHIRTAGGAGPAVIVTTTRVHVFDRFSGDRLQSFRPPFAPGGPAVGYGERLFMGGADGRFYSLLRNHPRSSGPVKRWVVSAGGPVTAAPVLYDQKKLLFASQCGTVYACWAEDKVLIWTFRTGGPILGDPAVDEHSVYVASTDRSLYRVDLETGRLRWRFRMPRPLLEGPVLVDHTVYQYGVANGLSAVDAATGHEKWREPEARSFAARTRRGDFLFTDDHRLQLVERETGLVRHALEVPAAVGTVVNTQDEAVYVLGRDGRLLCTRLDDTPYLRRQQVIAARARLHRTPRKEPVTVHKPHGDKARPVDLLESDPLRSRHDVRP